MLYYNVIRERVKTSVDSKISPKKTKKKKARKIYSSPESVSDSSSEGPSTALLCLVM